MEVNGRKFYHDMSTTMITRRLFLDYCEAKNKLLKYKIVAVGPEGFAESWIKEKLYGTTLQNEVMSKFAQLLYDLGNKKGKLK